MSHAPRAVLLGHLLRQGDLGRAARLIDRLDHAALAACVDQLDPTELRALAELALAESRVLRTSRLPLAALVALVEVATDGETRRLLSRLPPAPASRILLGLGRERRRQLGRALVDPAPRQAIPTPPPSPRRAGGGERLVAAFRRHRLFTAS